MTEAIQANSIQARTDRHWVGVDACRGGWILAELSHTQPLQLHFDPSLAKLLSRIPEQQDVLIDMILYRPDDPSPRQFDRQAKAYLGQWHSRVFPAPPQESLKADSYTHACVLSEQLTGKKISIQCYNLFPKMREAHALKQLSRKKHKSSAHHLIEYHPEIAFMHLHRNQPLAPSKKTPEGRALRRQCLEEFFGCLPAAPSHPSRQKPWVEDDLLDALALAAAAQTGAYWQFYKALKLRP